MSVSYTGSWTDVAKGYEAANAMINSGMSMLLWALVTLGRRCYPGLRRNNGRCKFVGFASDFNHLSPEIVICSAVQSTPL